MIVIDNKIPYIKGVFEPYFSKGEVVYLDGGKISAEDLKEAQALIIRTRTICDEKLLADSKVKIIASATIGADHIDKGYLDKKGVKWVTAPGCNAGGVCQYVFTSLYAVSQQKDIDLKGKTIGIIGVGNTGGRVAELAPKLGFKVLLNDPPREASEGSLGFCSLDELLVEADVVSCHVPLDETTIGMAEASFFDKLKKGTIFINASRGEVVDETALLSYINTGKAEAVILDVWRNESKGINMELLQKVDLATPHIAGYSLEGKINGTKAVVRAVARELGIEELLEFNTVPEGGSVPLLKIGEDQLTLTEQMLETFPIWDLDKELRDKTDDFEKIRSEYELRREFCLNHY